MALSTAAWLRRLQTQLPGWKFWWNLHGWHGVPADVRYTETEQRQLSIELALKMPGHIGPFPTPQKLREECRDRYSWYDTCECCGLLARDCGSRERPICRDCGDRLFWCDDHFACLRRRCRAEWAYETIHGISKELAVAE